MGLLNLAFDNAWSDLVFQKRRMKWSRNYE